MERISRTSTIQIVIINILFVAGAVFSNLLIRAIASFLLLFCILFFKEKNSVNLLIGLSPVQAILVLTDNGISLMGVFYLVLFLKQLFVKKVFAPISYWVCLLPLLFISFVIFAQFGSLYDFAIMCEFFVVICFLTNFLKGKSNDDHSDLIDAFLVGSLMCALNIVLAALLANGAYQRANGILDNANYIAITFVVAGMVSLIRFIKNKNSIWSLVLSGFFLLMVLTTGSRGAILALASSILWIVLFGFAKYKKVSIVLMAIFAGLAVLVVLYVAGNQFVTSLYDNMVLRTLNGLANGKNGYFMDVSSGRMTLWSFYLNEFGNNGFQSIVGLGSNRYYLSSNGGYGFYAHNVFIGSLMGIGALGTCFTLALYITFYKNIRFNQKYRDNLIAYSILIAAIVGYFFLDGLFDLRITIYFVLVHALNNSLFLKEERRKGGLEYAIQRI